LRSPDRPTRTPRIGDDGQENPLQIPIPAISIKPLQFPTINYLCNSCNLAFDVPERWPSIKKRMNDSPKITVLKYF
jgi:hypothetical protein